MHASAGPRCALRLLSRLLSEEWLELEAAGTVGLPIGGYCAISQRVRAMSQSLRVDGAGDRPSVGAHISMTFSQFADSFRRFFPVMGIALTAGAYQARATLIVDFSDSTANVSGSAAGFVFTNNSASPQTQNYLAGTQGYAGGSIDLGSGISVTLRSFNLFALDPAVLRLVDRDNAVADLGSDWAAVEPGVASGTMPTVGLQLAISGMVTGSFNFSSSHDDSGNQAGVLDVQYSTNGGLTWVDHVDNASYNSGFTTMISGVDLNGTDGLLVRYLAGGNLFGGNGQTTDNATSNRLMPLNSFDLAIVPEPSTVGVLAFGALVLARRRRERSLVGAPL